MLSSSWHGRPVGHNRHGPKIGGCVLWEEGSWASSDTIWPGQRPTSMPSFILIHAAVWPQQTWAKNCGVVPFGRTGAGPYLTQCGQDRGLPPRQVSSWSMQPFGHNTPTSQTDRHDRQTGQRSNSIGGTVLQTAAQKHWLTRLNPQWHHHSNKHPLTRWP